MSNSVRRDCCLVQKATGFSRGGTPPYRVRLIPPEGFIQVAVARLSVSATCVEKIGSIPAHGFLIITAALSPAAKTEFAAFRFFLFTFLY